MVSTRLRILHRRPRLLRPLSVPRTKPLQPLRTLNTARWLACRTRTNPSLWRQEPLRLASPASSALPATTHSQLPIVTPQRYHHRLLLHPGSKALPLCQTPPLFHHHRRRLRRRCRSPTSPLLLLPTAWRSMVCLCLHPRSPTPPRVLSSPMLGCSSSWQRSSPTWLTTLPRRWVRTLVPLHL